MSYSSYATISSPRLAEMCQKTIGRIQVQRDRMKEAYLAKVRHPWYRRWFGRAPYTAEERPEEVWASPFAAPLSGWDWDYYDWRTMGVARRLLNATKYAPEVHVTVEDLEDIT